MQNCRPGVENDQHAPGAHRKTRFDRLDESHAVTGRRGGRGDRRLRRGLVPGPVPRRADRGCGGTSQRGCRRAGNGWRTVAHPERSSRYGRRSRHGRPVPPEGRSGQDVRPWRRRHEGLCRRDDGCSGRRTDHGSERGRDHDGRLRRRGLQRRHHGRSGQRCDGRRGHRDRTHQRRGSGRAQGFRLGGCHHAGTRRPWLKAGRRTGRHHEDGGVPPGARATAGRSGTTKRRSAPRFGLGACIGHRRRPRDVELSRDLPPGGGEAHGSGRDGTERNRRAGRNSRRMPPGRSGFQGYDRSDLRTAAVLDRCRS